MLAELLKVLNVCFFPSTQRAAAGGKKTQKTTQEESDSEEDDSADPDDEDGEDEHAEEHPPPPATASWSSDHNYIAVTPEKTTPISPTVLNKKCMYLFEGLGLLLNCYFFHYKWGSCGAKRNFRNDPYTRGRTRSGDELPRSLDLKIVCKVLWFW